MEVPIVDPPIPYVRPIRGGRFTPGKKIKIQGIAPSTAYRFHINLQCGSETIPTDDIVIQVAVRLLDDCISLNSLKRGIWGEEHRNTAVPIKRSEKFEIILTCDFNQYKVTINGHHYEFPQRIHYNRITHLAIDGDVSINQISYESASGGDGVGAASGSEIGLITGGEAREASAPIITAPLASADDDFEIDTAIITAPPPGLHPAPAPDFTDPPSYESVMNNIQGFPLFSISSSPYSTSASYPMGAHGASHMFSNTTPYSSGVPVSDGSGFPPLGAPIIPPLPPPSASAPLNTGHSYRLPSVKNPGEKPFNLICTGFLVAIIVAVFFIVNPSIKR